MNLSKITIQKKTWSLFWKSSKVSEMELSLWKNYQDKPDVYYRLNPLNSSQTLKLIDTIPMKTVKLKVSNSFQESFLCLHG